MDKSLVIVYARIPPDLKKRLLALGKRHGHVQTKDGKAVLSSVIRWGLIEWIETKETENGQPSELAQLRAQVAQLEADLAAARHRAVSLTEGRPAG